MTTQTKTTTTPSSHPPSQPTTWKAAWEVTPGPKTRQEHLMLTLKGFCMGTADIIPGVSGGTIAFITGIYDQLLAAISSVNVTFVKKLLQFDLKGALSEIHLRFLITLFIGIAVAIVSTARVMHYLINEHPVPTWALFFGLIAASIIVVGKTIEEWNGVTLLAMGIGGVTAYFIVGLIPVTTPEAPWFIFFSGMIAICAMILPGLSGSFLLLILGKYAFVTGAIKNPFNLDNIVIIITFASGCLVGLLGFARILKYLLNHYHTWTMAFLTGIMIGAMRKVWPWKEVLETVEIRGKVHVLAEQNVLPTLDAQFALAAVLMVIGFVLVMGLERISNK